MISCSATAGITAYPPRATFGPRLLYDFEFIWIIAGHARATFDQQLIEARPGTILLGRPGQTQRIDWVRSNAPSTHTSISVSITRPWLATAPKIDWP